MQVVLVAGGKNERFKDLSIFPKVLLPYLSDGKSMTILKHYAELVDNNLILIINKRYSNQVKYYLSSNDIKNVNVIESTIQNGSFSTIQEVLDFLPSDEPILFIWSDLILSRTFMKTILNKNYDYNCIFTKSGNYRLKVENNLITNSDTNSGNIPGIYLVKNKSLLHTTKDYPDLAFIYNVIDFKEAKIDDEIIEFRDLDYYKTFVKNQRIKTRSFNNIAFDDETVTKTSNAAFAHLIQNEVSWYENSTKYLADSNFTPKLISSNSNSITLSRLTPDFKPLFEFKDFSDETLENLTSFIYKFIHSSDNFDIDDATYESDITLEFITKTISRINKIYGMLYNPIDYEDFVGLLHKAKEAIRKAFTPSYHFLHGDLNFSNILYNGQQFALLDPRGYFGNTKLFGPYWYEYGKIYYGLSGYDDFNQSFNYFYSKDNYDEPKPLLQEMFDSMPPEYKIIVGIIYINLTSYISDNIMKVNIAYQYGLKLLKQGFLELDS